MHAREYVIKLREHGLTQQQIADESSLNQPAISKIERGDVKDVRSSTLIALQKAYLKVAKRSDGQ